MLFLGELYQVKTPMGSADVMTDSCPSDIMGRQPNILWR